MISEGQRNDITCAIPLLEQIDIEGSHVLADRGYDSSHLIDYIYDHGGEPTIPSRKGEKFERRCDWWLYKERHLVEKLFLKLKAYRRIATRYDKLACTYLGFLCIASILIWLNLNFQPEIALKASQAEKLHVIGTLNLCFSHTHIMFFRKFKSCL